MAAERKKMMKFRSRLLLIAVVTLLVSVSAYANLNAVEYLYYSDATHATQVGYYILHCGNYDEGWGYTTAYRRVVKQNCSTGNVNSWCEQYINGSWQIVTCP